MGLLNRSFKIGRMFDIDIHVHVLFVLWMVFSMLEAGGAWLWHLTFLTLLFGVVLLHEFGHAFGARFMGGGAHSILLWPLGGLATVSPPRTPAAMAVTTLAGPGVNLALALFSGVLLLLVGGGWHLLLVNPFGSLMFAAGSPLIGYVWIFYQVNLLLFAFNLLPVYPLDGGQLLQCLLWPRIGERRAKQVACQVGLYGAVGMVLWALTSYGGDMLLFIGLVGGFTCYQQLQALKYGQEIDWRSSLRTSGSGAGGWWANARRRFGRKRRSGPGARGRSANRAARRRPRDAGWVDKVPDLDDDAKALLKKVEEQGIHTLTEEERVRLMEAFRRRRERDEYLH